MPSLNNMALSATLHCLTGCAIGETLGMVISSARNWPTVSSIVLSVSLAFFFSYLLTMWPLLRNKISFKKALGIALAADTASITIMEITDNAFILAWPGAIHAELTSPIFWASLSLSLVAAFLAAYPLNRYLISKGKGHCHVHNNNN